MFSLFRSRNPPSPVPQTQTPIETDNGAYTSSQPEGYRQNERLHDEVNRLRAQVQQLENEKRYLMNDRNTIQ
jgi:cell division protein FtsB